MKLYKILFILIGISVSFISCDEDEELPEFLDGTEFGILLTVDVNRDAIPLDSISLIDLNVDISYDDTERPVQSIIVQKLFTAEDGTASDVVEQMTVNSSPTNATLSIGDLVSGISDLAVDSIEVGDSFSIEFIINYVDGLVVDTYGTGVNPNFSVTYTGE